jgi:hypothetical protein
MIEFILPWKGSPDRRRRRLTGGVMSLVILLYISSNRFSVSLNSAKRVCKNASGPLT